MRAQEGDRPVELQVPVQHLAPPFVRVRNAHQPHHAPAPVPQRQLVRDVPVRHPLLIEKELYDVPLRLTRPQHFFIIPAKALRQPWRKQVEIIPPDHLRFLAKTETLPNFESFQAAPPALTLGGALGVAYDELTAKG